MSCLRKLFDAAKDPKHDELLRTFAKIEPAPNSRLKKRRSHVRLRFGTRKVEGPHLKQQTLPSGLIRARAG